MILAQCRILALVIAICFALRATMLGQVTDNLGPSLRLTAIATERAFDAQNAITETRVSELQAHIASDSWHLDVKQRDQSGTLFQNNRSITYYVGGQYFMISDPGSTNSLASAYIFATRPFERGPNLSQVLFWTCFIQPALGITLNGNFISSNLTIFPYQHCPLKVSGTGDVSENDYTFSTHCQKGQFEAHPSLIKAILHFSRWTNISTFRFPISINYTLDVTPVKANTPKPDRWEIEVTLSDQELVESAPVPLAFGTRIFVNDDRFQSITAPYTLEYTLTNTFTLLSTNSPVIESHIEEFKKRRSWVDSKNSTLSKSRLISIAAFVVLFGIAVAICSRFSHHPSTQ